MNGRYTDSGAQYRSVLFEHVRRNVTVDERVAAAFARVEALRDFFLKQSDDLRKQHTASCRIQFFDLSVCDGGTIERRFTSMSAPDR